MGYLFALAIALLLGGCQLRGDVSVRINPDGSGLVTVKVGLDSDAVERLGDPKMLRTTDIRDAGWVVSGPTKADSDGVVWYSAVKRLHDFTDLQPTLGEIGGQPGLFQDFKLSVVDGFGDTSYEVNGRLVAAGTLAQFSDPKATTIMGGLPLGRTPAELTADGATTPGAVRLTLAIELPGKLTATSGKTTDANTATWTADLTAQKASTADVHIASQVRSSQARRLTYAGMALIALAGLLALLAWRKTKKLDRVRADLG